MRKILASVGSSRLRNRNALALTVTLATLAGLLWYKLGNLAGGLSAGEIKAASEAVGWHGIFNAPQDLPLKIVRSIAYFLAPDHGATLSRLPNTLFGLIAVSSFAWLVWLWHGRRTAIFMTALFASSAWVLHTSRLVSFDVLYLCVVPLLLLTQALLYRNNSNPLVWYASIIVWGMLLYIPGAIWLVVLHLFLQRKTLLRAWSESQSRRRLLTVFASSVWLPLLLLDFSRQGHFVQWLGLPTQFESLAELAKNFAGVFVHLFVRGPQYPDLWLGRAPLFDVFTLLIAVVGIYFYAKRRSAWRSRTLGLMFAIGVVLVAMNGPVSLSLLVPMLYIAAAAGIAYLLHEWFSVFPQNPIARSVGIGLVAVLVSLSCLYNLRAYFIAWPHNTITKETFRYHR